MNYYEKENWSRIVYTIDCEKDGYPIIEHKLGDIVWDYAETTSDGWRCMSVDGDGLYSREAGHQPELVRTFDTEAEANHALLLCHRFDMHEKRGTEGNPWVFECRADAESMAREMLEEDIDEDDEPVSPTPVI